MADTYLGKNEIRFWLPIIISIVSMALSYGAVVTRIVLVEQKQDDILAGITEIKATLKSDMAEHNVITKQIAVIQTMLGIK